MTTEREATGSDGNGVDGPDRARAPGPRSDGDLDTHSLFALAETVAHALPLDEVLARVVDQVRAVLDPRAVWVRLLDPTTGRLVVRAWRAPFADGLLAADVAAGQGPAWLALERQQIVSTHDLEAELAAAPHDQWAAAGLDEALFVPLLAGGRALGVLVVCPATREQAAQPGQRLLATLSLLAAHAAVAIQYAAARADAEATRARAEGTARRLTAIQRLEEAVAHVSDLPSLLGRAASLAAAALGGRRGAVALVEWPEGGRRGGTGQLVLGTAAEVWTDFPWRRLPLGRYADLLVLLQSKRRAVVLERPGEDPRLGRFRRFLADAGVRQLVLAPVISSGRLLGALAVDDGGRADPQAGAPSPFGPDDIALAESLGARLGAAVDRIRLVESERRRSRELLALQRTTQHLASTLSLSALLPVVVEEATKLLEVDGAVLRLRDGDELVLAARSAALRGLALPLRVPIEGSVSGLSALRDGPVMVRDLATDPRTRHRPVWPSAGFRSHLAVPIRTEGSVAGVLGFFSRRLRRFETREAELAATLGDVVAVAIENARLFERVSLASREWESSFGAMRDGVALVDGEGRIVRANDALGRLLGIPASALAGRPFAAVAPGLPAGGEAPVEGKILTLAVSPLAAADGREVGAVHVVREVTAERRLQQQLLQSEKLASIGQLVSGVAHELNNPLAAILGYAELLHRRALDPALRRDLEQVLAQTERAARIVNNLLAFARNHRPEARRLSLNDVVRTAVELQAYDLRVSNLQVELALDPDLPAVMADFHQLEEVVVNVLVNAKQAILSARQDGRVRIETRTAHGADGARVVRLTIRDNGPGIPREHLHRIFDPFFTTKAVGVGTGLGLSICFGIVQAHGGRIWAETLESAGAAISVDLPVAPAEGDRAPSSEGPAPFSPPQEHRASLTAAEDDQTPSSEGPDRFTPPKDHRASLTAARILVVDDEPAIRDVVKGMLEADGFEVETAEDGVSAAAHLAAEPFDLVIADVRMPGMGGLELADWIASHRPALFDRLVFMTGDTVGASTRRLLDTFGRPFLGKPFTHADLRAVLAEALGHARAAVTP